MEEVSQIYPLRNQRSKVPTRAPLQKLPKFSFPLRKKPIFFQTPRKYSKDQRHRRSDPPRNDDQGPLRKCLPSGGVDIKWNGPPEGPKCTYGCCHFETIHYSRSLGAVFNSMVWNVI